MTVTENTLEFHRREKSPMLKWNAPKYYDHPDGQDLMGKLSFVVKNFTTFATLAGVVYAGQSPSSSVLDKAVRVAKFTLPGAAMGFTFTCVTYVSTVIREKDDLFNHTVGGIAAGTILGPAMGKPTFSISGALLFGSLACLNKHYNTLGYDIGGKPYRRSYSPYFERKLNSTLLPEIKGNWTREP